MNKNKIVGQVFWCVVKFDKNMYISDIKNYFVGNMKGSEKLEFI